MVAARSLGATVVAPEERQTFTPDQAMMEVQVKQHVGRVGGVARLPRSLVLQTLAVQAAFPNSMAHIAFLKS
ncbi:hypothetical protein TherJR_0866 [Thermincola potens JR]|uniref:Uncharacterized protein n=1 Tax=Thermincola potens (strain JR) TaxID=635013 RepID=D5XD85_THEPJ|nr:hypothetical protein TherJR_0866 [Thermincola potens JR]